MHELPLAMLPIIGGPVWALQMWLAGRRARRVAAPGNVAIGEKLALTGSYPDARGGHLHLGKLRGSFRVLVFMSNRCPGVKAYDERLNGLATHFRKQGVEFVGVNSVPEQLYPRETFTEMRTVTRERGLVFPYIKDTHQILARQFDAICTPQVFVLDEHGALRYRGRIDDSFLPAKVKVRNLHDALDAMLRGGEVAVPEAPPLGCHLDRIVDQPRASRGIKRPRQALA